MQPLQLKYAGGIRHHWQFPFSPLAIFTAVLIFVVFFGQICSMFWIESWTEGVEGENRLYRIPFHKQQFWREIYWLSYMVANYLFNAILAFAIAMGILRRKWEWMLILAIGISCWIMVNGYFRFHMEGVDP